MIEKVLKKIARLIHQLQCEFDSFDFISVVPIAKQELLGRDMTLGY